ncbi:hypothetical protein B0H19DRAFT_1091186 [Mycena capillaripes]|nr:hypothetical protein B0H19DRAFT_1091186 [Mycena capillaripes]
MRLASLPFGVLLTNLVPVYGKGGGKTSTSNGKPSDNSGSSKGSSSSSSSGKSNGGTSVTVISTGGTTICYNENNEIIRCPPNSARKNLIIGAVVGGIFGAILLGFLLYCVVMRIREKRRQREKKTILPSLSFGKPRYKPLHDQSDAL